MDFCKRCEKRAKHLEPVDNYCIECMPDAFDPETGRPEPFNKKVNKNK